MKKIFLTLFLLIIITPVLIGGYFGLVPGVSALFGSNKPRDLGVSPSAEALSSGNQKTGVALAALPADTSMEQSLQYVGSHEVEMTLTSAEITSMANNSKWAYSPISAVQVRINPDGSAEASGLIDFNAAVNYAKALGVSSSDIDKALSKYPVPRTKFPFYLKGTGHVANNQISLDLTSVELARIPVPVGIVKELTPGATSFVESKYLGEGKAVSIDTLENRSGQVYFKGTVPDQELTVNQ